MKLAGLVLKCHELGLPATSKDTKGGLLAKLRTYYEGEEGTSFDPKAPLTWSRFAGRTPEDLALNEPDFIDWCLVTARESKVSPQLARLVEWAEQERAAGRIPGSSGSAGSSQMPIRPRLAKVEPPKVKVEVTPPTGPDPPQWDGREEALEAYMRQAKAYAALKKELTAPMDTRDKRKDAEPTSGTSTPRQR